MSRKHGFTLIELLVVIAIIGILAAMLFPVFARARESARKIQCLSNVKNIAIAIQMYLSDYDRFPPHEHRAEVLSYFSTSPGVGGPATCDTSPNARVDGVNPFLRWPVVFDEYIKNRDVWRCPSAKTNSGAAYILPSDWFGDMVNHQGEWGYSTDLPILCSETIFPPGWGGSVTDSLVQHIGTSTSLGTAGASGFEQEIGTGEQTGLCEASTTVIGDPATMVVCADSLGPSYYGVNWIMFPDTCKTQCGSMDAGCCNAEDDWSVHAADKHELWEGGEMNRYTRHMGGSNLGFGDGHAKWMTAGALLAASKAGKNFTQFSDAATIRITPDPESIWAGCICEYGY